MNARPLLVAGVASALLLAACSGSDSSTTTLQPSGDTAAEVATTTTVTAAPMDNQATLAEALTKTTEFDSGRMEGSFEISGVEGLPTGTGISLPFSGSFDNEADAFTFTMDMSSMAGDLGGDLPAETADMFGVMEVRQFGDTTYMRWPFFSFLGVQTEWVSMPTEDSGSTTADFAAAAPGNPGDFLSFFGDTDASVEEVGRETVRGVETTHYLAVFDTAKLLEEATPEERAEIEAQGPIPLEEMPMDIWIGDDGLVYRYVVDITGDTVAASPGEGFERMLMTFEMYDWGEDIDIEVPPADQVTDGSEFEALFGP